VLAFANMSGDPEQDYFADGMAEEIITALSRCNWLLVAARNSSFTYKEKVVDVRQIGRELGVRCVLGWSVRRHGNRLRITGQLIDATSDTQIWADRFDGEMSDVFELQDRIAESVVVAIEPMLQLAEIDRLRLSQSGNLDSFVLFLRAQQRENEFHRRALRPRLATCNRLLPSIPHMHPPLPWQLIATRSVISKVGLAAERCQAEGVRLAWRAFELGKDDGNVLWMAAFAIWTLAQDAQRAGAIQTSAVGQSEFSDCTDIGRLGRVVHRPSRQRTRIA
jgi:TolB-like protein